MTTALVVDIPAAASRVLRYVGSMQGAAAAGVYADAVALVQDRAKMRADLDQLASDQARVAGYFRLIKAANELRDHEPNSPAWSAAVVNLVDAATKPAPDGHKKRGAGK